MVRGWKECLIKDVLKPNGIKIGPFGSQLKKEMLLNDGFFKVYGQENVYENDFSIGDRYLTREHFQKLSSCEILPGDFLMSTMGTIGKCVIVPSNITPGIMDSHLIRLRFDESIIDPRYVLQLFSDQYSFLQNQIQKLSVGGIMDGLSVGIVSNIRIVFPADLEEQNRILATFTDVDRLISESKLLTSKYKAMKQGCLQHMFPRKGQAEPDIRLSGFTGAWEQRKLVDIATMHARIGWQNLRTSEFLDDGDYYLITGTDFKDGRIDFSSCHYVVKERYNQDKNIQIHNGSILITKDGTLGKVAYISGLNKPATLNAGVFNVVIKANDVDEKYLYYYLAGPFLMDYVSKRATGGTIKHLNQNILVDFPVVLPSYDEQRKIGETLQDLDDLITIHQRKCEKYKMIKQGMMVDLLTGKVRLK